ncbi:MAG: hypothetical protein AAGD88_12810, partial [Bacteroidota bacterium]
SRLTTRAPYQLRGHMISPRGHQMSSARTIICDDEALSGNRLRAYTLPGCLERRQNALTDQTGT